MWAQQEQKKKEEKKKKKKSTLWSYAMNLVDFLTHSRYCKETSPLLVVGVPQTKHGFHCILCVTKRLVDKKDI
jgi:hypothetical protein